ncbi:MAG: DUF2202 domain-containing protein [Sphingobacteriales bacterium]|nr:DUF2202 domain-containing protein [Sphingobacteriales bacterium]
MKRILVTIITAVVTLTGIAQQTNTLSQADKDGLLFMQEEEKLARDVYDSMYSQWGLMPFGNIRQSERVHLDWANKLIGKYELIVSAVPAEDRPGGFRNKLLQQFYKELIRSGSKSTTGGLQAGALIEEADIADLDQRMAQTTKEDILAAYQYLKTGSENHLRAFVRNLRMRGVEYIPVKLDKNRFDSIISGANRNSGCGKGGANCRGITGQNCN